MSSGELAANEEAGPFYKNEELYFRDRLNPKPVYEESLESYFVDDLAALSINLELLLGIGAHDARSANILGEKREVLGQPLQKGYIELLKELSDTGKHRQRRLRGCTDPYASIFDNILCHTQEYKDWRDLGHALERLWVRKRALFIDGVGRVPPKDELDFLEHMEQKEILRPSNIRLLEIFAMLARNSNEEHQHIDFALIHPEIALIVTDPRYWSGKMDKALVRFTEADPGNRVKRRHRFTPELMKWMRSEYFYLKMIQKTRS